MKKISTLTIWVLLLSPLSIFAQEEKFDKETSQKIFQEEMTASKIMDIAYNLTDGSGPRLAISPGYTRAANYAVQQLKSWGLTDAKLDAWGEFGKGWELQRSYIAMTAPYYKPLIGMPKAWTVGTNGMKNADVVLIAVKDSASLDAYRGKLAGKIIILDRMDVYKHTFKADANRHNDESLQKLADAMPSAGPNRGPMDTAELRRRRDQLTAMRATQQLPNIIKNFAKAEGALAMLSTGARNHDGTVFVQGGGLYKATDPENFLDMAVGIEDYMPLVRLIKAGRPVKIETDVKTQFSTNDIKG